MNFDTLSVAFLLIGAVCLIAMLVQRTPTGATSASPRRVMRHINKRRRFMGLPALYLGDCRMPKGWTCNDVRRQEWEGKR